MDTVADLAAITSQRAMNRYFKLHSMDCAEEVAVIKGELGPLVGAERFLACDVLNDRMRVLVPGSDISSADV